MDDTTVKIHRSTKEVLDSLKEDYESYDEVINKLISEVQDKNLMKKLEAAYKGKAEEDKKINKEWDKASTWK